MRWVGNLAHVGNKRNGYRVFTGTPRRKRSLGRPRHISDDYHQSDLKETWQGSHGLDSSATGQGQVWDSCEQGNEHEVSIKFDYLLRLAENLLASKGLCSTESVSSYYSNQNHSKYLWDAFY